MRPQPLISVSDVEASSRSYQHLLGCTSAHGGTKYERLNHRPAGSRWVRQSAASPTCRGFLFVFYPKISVLFRNVLRPDVLDDRLIRDHPRTRHEESPCPQMTAPALLVQMAELLQKLT
jgi:hypothetical protein